jgi:serine phosphatase RsbU (regulator of sigma subunit)
MIPMPEYRDEVFSLESQDIVLLATDGVLEMLAGGPRDVCSTIGQCQLVDMLRKAPHDLAEIHRRILSSGDSVTNGRDDVALLGLQLTE